MADILIVDDDESIATAFQRFLQYEGHDYRVASDAEEALRMIRERRPNLVFMDVRMPGRDGLQTLTDIRGQFPDLYVVIMTAYGTSQTSIEAIRAGAFDYLTKPLDLDQLRGVIAKALSTQKIREGADARADAVMPPDVRLVGETAAMHDVYKLIGRLATNDVPALVVGERGTGKELVTRTIHENSGRSGRPFASIDCATLVATELAETPLATASGTVHLAGVERLSALLQARLAAALSTERPAGAAPPIAARLLASTDCDLAHLVREGSFNPALYDALSVVTLHLPPLRDRRSDTPLLVRHFIHRFNEELARSITGVDDEVAHRLQAHVWPGNVGELERVIKRACIVARSDVITIDEITEPLSEGRLDRRAVETTMRQAVRTVLHERLVDAPSDPAWSPFHEIVDLVEQTLVEEALDITKGNQVKAADILGVNRATLRKKMPADQP
jgi:two-component system nitrogen regulation response regulator GlnG